MSVISTIRSVSKRPEWKAAATSCLLLSLGDVTCQVIINKSKSKSKFFNLNSENIAGIGEIDWQRTRRFSILGFTLHGPYFFHGFQWLDRIVAPSKSLSTALTKAMIAQVTVFPIYLVTFFTYMGLLERGKLSHSMQKLKDGFWPTFQMGGLFWTVANVINFMFVPSSSRLLYVSSVGVIWNAYTSWINSQSTQVQIKNE